MTLSDLAAVERPQNLWKDDPTWTESYAFDGYDTASGVALFLHMSRTAWDPTLWREFFVLVQPDGTILKHLAFGRGATSGAAAAAMLSFECHEPLTRWTVTYAGVARAVTHQELLSGPMHEGPLRWVRLDCTFEACSDPWDFAGSEDMQRQNFGHAHYEQFGTLRGTLDVDGAITHIDAWGFRDRSFGPRNFVDLVAHAWIHGRFEDGRTVALFTMDVRTPDGSITTSLNRALLHDANGRREARVISGAIVHTSAEADRGYLLRLGDGAREVEIHAELAAGDVASLQPPNTTYAGVHPDATVLGFHFPTTFSWDGIKGFGMTERTVPTGS